jgi:hypothetical protein
MLCRKKHNGIAFFFQPFFNIHFAISPFYLGTARRMAPSRRFFSLFSGYRADGALARRKKSAP